MNRELETRSKALIKLDEKIAELKAKRRSMLLERQQTCDHKETAECDYQPSRMTDGYSMPPIRLCLGCGLTEEGWGCGYVVLRGKHPKTISRHDLYARREGLFIRDEHKGPLLRSEMTIQQLLTMKEHP